MNNKYTFFFSDLHLGLPDKYKSLEREKKMVKLLDQIKHEAIAIWFVGDTFDFWWEYKHVIPRGFTRFLGKLCELNDMGIKIHMMTGNHDVWISDFFSRDLNITVHYKEIEIIINDKKFFIAHGDGLGKGDYGYKFLKKIFTNKCLQWCFTRLHPNFAFGLARLWSHSRRIKEKEYKFDGEENEILIQFSKQLLTLSYYDFMIFGHRHFPVELSLNDRTKYFNIGDWLVNFTYLRFDGNEVNMFTFLNDTSQLYMSKPDFKVPVNIF